MVGDRSRAGVVLGALGLLIGGAISGFAVGGLWLSLSIEAGSLAAILLLRSLLQPEHHGRTRARILSLVIIAGLPSSLWLVEPRLRSVLAPLYKHLGTPPPPEFDFWQHMAGLLIVGSLVVALNWLFERPPSSAPIVASARGSQRVDDRLLRDVRSQLAAELNAIDQAVSWNDRRFVSLEAEVEVESRPGSRRRREKNLVEALRAGRSDCAYLVLGEPGAGKSVALRRLARCLLDEVEHSGVIPVYVDLKAWRVTEASTSAPTIEALAKAHLERVLGADLWARLEARFDAMRRARQLFWIFDSFDEMPAIIERDDASRAGISLALSHFLNADGSCHGVLASRLFRKPTRGVWRRIQVCPFSDRQIVELIEVQMGLARGEAELRVRRLLQDRPQLVAAIHNPLIAGLLADYVDHAQRAGATSSPWPSSLFVLFDDCLKRRLRSEVIDTATRVAAAIYSRTRGPNNSGLDIGLSDLQQIDRSHLRALESARLVRVSEDEFSFTHRRFAEYFAARSLDKVHVEDIFLDARWRDVYVLYCCTAPVERVAALLERVWNGVCDGMMVWCDPDRHTVEEIEMAVRRAIHGLRFLSEAGLSRPDAVYGFKDHFTEAINTLIKEREVDLLIAKIATEVLALVALVDEDAAQHGFEAAFGRESSWVADTAMASCRRLPRLKLSVVHAIESRVRRVRGVTLLRRFWDVDFSLSLSDSLQGVRRRMWWDGVSFVGLVLISAILLLSAPVLALWAALGVGGWLFWYVETRAAGWLYGNDLDVGSSVDAAMRVWAAYGALGSVIVGLGIKVDGLAIPIAHALYSAIGPPQVLILLLGGVFAIPAPISPRNKPWRDYLAAAEIRKGARGALSMAGTLALLAAVVLLLGWLVENWLEQYKVVMAIGCSALLAIAAPVAVTRVLHDRRSLARFRYDRELDRTGVVKCLQDLWTGQAQTRLLDELLARGVEVRDIGVSPLPSLRSALAHEAWARLQERAIENRSPQLRETPQER